MYDGGQLHAQNARYDLNKNVKRYGESVPLYVFFCQYRSFYDVSN